MSPPISFVLGAPRSGTTLLRVMLAGHPRLFVPPEMVLAPYVTMAAREAGLNQRYWEKGGLRRALMELRGIDVEEAKAAEDGWRDLTVEQVYHLLIKELGGRILVDKCPHLGMPDGSLERVHAMFPEARYLWIVRHPGSVNRSLENMPMAEVMLQGYPGGPRDVWETANRRVGAFLRQSVPEDRWALVRYEDLVVDPEHELRRLSSALNVDYDAAMAKPYEGERMRTGPKGARAIGDPNMAGRNAIDPSLASKWLDGFDPRKVSASCKALALEFGYDLDSVPLPAITRVDEAIHRLWRTAETLLPTLDMAQDIDALEGRRFLLRMVAASVDTFLEYADPDHPIFHHGEGPTRKMFADNPDTDYHRAVVRTGPGRRYRVTGRVAHNTTYLGVLLYGRGGRIGNKLVDRQLNIDEEGYFTVYLSTDDPAGQDGSHDGVWLKADGDETAIFVRQYFTDRSLEPAVDLGITLLNAGPPAPLAVGDVARSVELAERMLQAVFSRTRQAHQMATAAALNQFIQIPGEALFPTPDNTYQVCWYRFGRDQVMLVRGRLPRARYFSFCLYNAWMESLDYLRHQVSRNHAQIQAEADGTFEIALAHVDPGHPNWLDTTGHHAGYLLARSLLLEGEVSSFTIQVMYDHEWAAERARRGW